MGWYIALKGPWRHVDLPTPLTVANDETGEIIEHFGGFDGLYRNREESNRLLDRIARALGPAVRDRWEADDESLDLAAEVSAAVARGNSARRMLDEALNTGDGSYRA